MLLSNSIWLDAILKHVRQNKIKIMLSIIGSLVTLICGAFLNSVLPDHPLTRLVNWYNAETYTMKKHTRFSVLVATLHRDNYDQKDTKALARILSNMNAFDVEMPGKEIDPYQSTGVIGLNDKETIVKAQNFLKTSYCDVIVYGQCVNDVVELGFASRQSNSTDEATGKLTTFKIDRLELQNELSDKLHGEFLSIIVSAIDNKINDQFSFVDKNFMDLLLKINEYVNKSGTRSPKHDVALKSSFAAASAICGQQLGDVKWLEMSMKTYNGLIDIHNIDSEIVDSNKLFINYANALTYLGAITKDIQRIESAIDEFERIHEPGSKSKLTTTEEVDLLVGKGVALLKKYEIEGTDIRLLQQSADCYRYAMISLRQLPEKSKAILYLNYGVTLLKQGVVTEDVALIQKAIKYNRLALAVISKDSEHFLYYRAMFNLADCYKSMYAIEKYSHWLVSASKAYNNAEMASPALHARHIAEARLARGLVGAQIAVKQKSDKLCTLYSDLLHKIAGGKFYPKNSYLYFKALSSSYALQTYFAVMHNNESMQDWLFEGLHEMSETVPVEYGDITRVINDSQALLNRSAVSDFTVF